MPRKSWWARLPFGVRMAAGVGALLIAIGGGAAGISAMTSEKDPSRAATAVDRAAAGQSEVGQSDAGQSAIGQAAVGQAEPAESDPQLPAHRAPVAKAQFGADAAMSRTSDEADRNAPRVPHRKAVPAGSAPAPVKAAVPVAAPPSAADAPVVTTRTEVETREIPFQTRLVRDPTLPSGTRQVQTPGVAGEQTLRYLVTLTDGEPTARRLLDTTITRLPQYQVVAFGDSYAPAPAPAPDRRRHCGEALNFCVPLGRVAICPADQDQLRDEDSAIQLGGTVTMQDPGLDVLPTDEQAC